MLPKRPMKFQEQAGPMRAPTPLSAGKSRISRPVSREISQRLPTPVYLRPVNRRFAGRRPGTLLAVSAAKERSDEDHEGCRSPGFWTATRD